MTGENALFTGEDDAPSEEVLPNDQPPLSGRDPIGLRAWANDLTYREVHAFTAGFAPVLLGVLATALVPEAAVFILGAAAMLTVAASLGARGTRLVGAALVYIVKEPHYLWGGQLLGVLLGTFLLGVYYLVAYLTGLVGGLL